MRILIVTPHFHPESFKCNDMAFELQKRGHEVSVMTAIPDYPEGKFFKGYGVFRKRREIVNGVEIHRSLIIPRGSGSAFRLALNYASYTLFATLKALWFGLVHKYDAIIVHETSPVMVGIPAVIIKKIQRIPLYFWVLDLWPESLSAAGGIENGTVLGVFEKLTKWIYGNSNKILISSKGFEESICKKGDFRNRIEFFPNWIDDALQTKREVATTPCLHDGFNLLFAGNIGEAQDFPHILDTALNLRDRRNIHFNFVGDGRKRKWVEEFIDTNNLSRTVHCWGRYSLSAMPSFFDQADILFLALKKIPIFALTTPAKLQAYMSSGKPIVAMIDGEGADVIAEADCGWSVPAESPEKLTELLIELSNTDPMVLRQKGANGKAFSLKHYEFYSCMNHLCDILSSDR